MAQFISGSADTFRALAYGTPHASTTEFLHNQMQGVGQNLTQAGQQFFQGARDLYERFSGSSAMAAARLARRAVGGLWESNEIRALIDTVEQQRASLPMQRWAMANPYVRQKYHNQTIEGYEGSYKDAFPEDIGENHYDYRRVVNGILVEDEDGWSATTYFDELLPDDRELEHDEQLDIATMWQFMKDNIKRGGEDPTSLWGAHL